MSELFAGLDVSTQSCKIVVVDLDTQAVLYVDSVNYDTDLAQYQTKNGVMQGQAEGVSESDPQMWIDALHMIFQKLKQSDIAIGHIKCISVSGQQHGLVTLDAQGNLTRTKSKLWNDFSTLEECGILTDKVGGHEVMIEEVGNSQRTGYTAAKIFHMQRHEKDAFDKTATFFLVHNYINWYLTGGKDGGVRAMEPGDASGMALWHPGKRTLSSKVLDAIDPALKDKLPPITASDASIGTIGSALVEQYGFDASCKIDAGCGDNMYGAVGTGNVTPGIVTISLGTSGTAYTFMEKAYVDPTGEIAAFCDSTGHFLPLLCVSNLANGYNEILRIHKIDHATFNEIAQKTPPGNNGKVLIPWYVGERTPDVPLASPVYFGFGLDDFTIENLSRAVLEGHILNLADGFARMPVSAKEIRLTGGISKSDVWSQTIADVFEAETVPVEGEGAALGAALHAAWVWKKEAGVSVSLADMVAPFVVLDESRRKKPIPENVKIYRKQKALFSALSSRVRGVEGADPFVLRDELLSLS